MKNHFLTDQANKMVDFAQFNISHVFFIDLAFIDHDRTYYTTLGNKEYRLLFVNTNGDGMLIGLIPNFNGSSHVGIAMMSAEEIDIMFNKQPNKLPIAYALMDEVKLPGKNSFNENVVRCILNESEYRYTADNYYQNNENSSYKQLVVKAYFKKNLSSDEFYNMLQYILNHPSTNRSTVIDSKSALYFEDLIKYSVNGTFWMGNTFEQFAQYLNENGIVEVRKP